MLSKNYNRSVKSLKSFLTIYKDHNPDESQPCIAAASIQLPPFLDSIPSSLTSELGLESNLVVYKYDGRIAKNEQTIVRKRLQIVQPDSTRQGNVKVSNALYFYMQPTSFKPKHPSHTYNLTLTLDSLTYKAPTHSSTGYLFPLQNGEFKIAIKLFHSSLLIGSCDLVLPPVPFAVMSTSLSVYSSEKSIGKLECIIGVASVQQQSVGEWVDVYYNGLWQKYFLEMSSSGLSLYDLDMRLRGIVGRESILAVGLVAREVIGIQAVGIRVQRNDFTRKISVDGVVYMLPALDSSNNALLGTLKGLFQ